MDSIHEIKNDKHLVTLSLLGLISPSFSRDTVPQPAAADLKRTGSSEREDRVQFLKVTGIYFSLKSLKQSQIQRLPVFVMFL